MGRGIQPSASPQPHPIPPPTHSHTNNTNCSILNTRFCVFNSSVTDRRTDGPTNRQTDGQTGKASFTVACPQLKKIQTDRPTCNLTSSFFLWTRDSITGFLPPSVRSSVQPSDLPSLHGSVSHESNSTIIVEIMPKTTIKP